MDELIGRCTIPLRIDVEGAHVEVGTVQVDLDLAGIRYDVDTGQLYGLLDMHVEGESHG